MEIDSHKDALSLKEPHLLQQSEMKVNIVEKADPPKRQISYGNKSFISGEVRDDKVVSSSREPSPSRDPNTSFDCLPLVEYDKTNTTRAIPNEDNSEKPAGEAELSERRESMPFEREESVADRNELHEISLLDDTAKRNKSTVDYDLNKKSALDDTTKKNESTVHNDVNERLPLDDTTKNSKNTIDNDVDERSQLDNITNKNKSMVDDNLIEKSPLDDTTKKKKNTMDNDANERLPLDDTTKKNKSTIGNDVNERSPRDHTTNKNKNMVDDNQIEKSLLNDISKKKKSTIDDYVNEKLPLDDTTKKNKNMVDENINEKAPLDDTTKKNPSTVNNNVNEKSKRGEILVDFKPLHNPQDSRNTTKTTERRPVKKLLTGKFEFKRVKSILTVVKTSVDSITPSSSVTKDSPNSVNNGESIEITNQSNLISETRDSEHSSSILKTLKDSEVNTSAIKSVKDSKASRVIPKTMNKQSDSFVKSLKDSVQHRDIVKPPIIPGSNSISQRQRISMQPGFGESVLGSKGDSSDGSPKSDDSKNNKRRVQSSDLSESIYYSSINFDTWTRKSKSNITIQSDVNTLLKKYGKQVKRGTTNNTHCTGSSGSLSSVEDIISIETDLSDVTLGSSSGPAVLKTSMRIGNLVIPDKIALKKPKRRGLRFFRKKFWARSKERMSFRK